ncbi:MAG: ABC transporter permease [Oscillospiraceae bacterium]|nr:ABC transporter permease [Oscillospiraceae bacterium]
MSQFTPNDWAPCGAARQESDQVSGASTSYGKEVLCQFARRWTAVLGVLLVAVTLVLAIVGPIFSENSYDNQQRTYVSTPPLLPVYDVGGQHYYVSTSGKLLLVDGEGMLQDAAPSLGEERENKRYVYELDGETYYLNYRSSPFTLEDAQGRQQPMTRVWNRRFPLGSDYLGRDIMVRLMYGARISLTVAFVATLVNLVIGILYGSVSGYLGGMVDVVMMRVVDIISSIPLTMYVILIMVLFDNGGLTSIIIALGSVYWVDMARVVRGEMLSLKKQEYVSAAHTMGSSTWYILRRHLIPNTMGPIIVTATMQIPSAIFTEAFMSFIGLGVSAPMASLGTMCNDALETLQIAPYQLAFPAGAICIAMFAFNFIGDGLRDAFDPQMRK